MNTKVMVLLGFLVVVVIGCFGVVSMFTGAHDRAVEFVSYPTEDTLKKLLEVIDNEYCID
jgi:hypothetical protein